MPVEAVRVGRPGAASRAIALTTPRWAKTVLGGFGEWPSHITWVRYGVKRDSAALLGSQSMI
jgi:hypothetical protein